MTLLDRDRIVLFIGVPAPNLSSMPYCFTSTGAATPSCELRTARCGNFGRTSLATAGKAVAIPGWGHACSCGAERTGDQVPDGKVAQDTITLAAKLPGVGELHVNRANHPERLSDGMMKIGVTPHESNRDSRLSTFRRSDGRPICSLHRTRCRACSSADTRTKGDSGAKLRVSERPRRCLRPHGIRPSGPPDHQARR